MTIWSSLINAFASLEMPPGSHLVVGHHDNEVSLFSSVEGTGRLDIVVVNSKSLAITLDDVHFDIYDADEEVLAESAIEIARALMHGRLSETIWKRNGRVIGADLQGMDRRIRCRGVTPLVLGVREDRRLVSRE